MSWFSSSQVKNLSESKYEDFEEISIPEDDQEIYLSKYLSERGKYAYAALCASILRELFYSDFKEFCHKTLDVILGNLSVSEEVDELIRVLLTKGNDNNEYELTWVSTLFTERILKRGTKLLIKDLIYLALRDSEYDARWRVLIHHFAKLMGSADQLEECESSVFDFILRGNDQPSEEEKQKLRKRQSMQKLKRYSLISAVTIGSGALVGFTGGLAAPVIVESLGAIMGASAFGAATVSALSTTMGTTIIASLFGTAGASLAGYKISKRYGEVKEFAFGQLVDGGTESNNEIPLVEKPQLSATIAISGWIKDYEENNFSYSWKSLHISKEQYYLRYESASLYELGQAMEKSTGDSVIKAALEPFKYTIFRGVIKGITLPTLLLGFASIIDLPWSVGCSKAILVGKHLAEVLLSKQYGRRPITLIGYSLGARVIYHCLLEMSEREGSVGILENVYLIGAPCPADPVKWLSFTKIVAGTITNAYSDGDTLLKFLYRTLSLPDGGVAGLKPIEASHRRIRNVDLSSIISGHSEYPLKLNKVLKELDIQLKNDTYNRLLQPSTSWS